VTAASRPRRHRLYWRIWLAILVAVALFALLASTAWHLMREQPRRLDITGFAELASEVLPPAEAPREAQQAALQRWQQRLGADFALQAADGTRIAGTRDDLEVLSRREGPSDPHVMTPRGPALALQLPDGRTLLMLRPGRPGLSPPPGPVATFILLALGVGVGAYPVVRRLTRRLERLQAGVNQWGAGNLSARVDVEGHDEVAQLAQAFNDAAARIEQLLGAHRTLLANASHELRSPLARIRLGIELLSTDPSPARREELTRDIGELDQLIDEILLASRLEGGTAPEREPIDLTALVAEECARAAVPLQAEPAIVTGSARLLRRLMRNLIDNARRHGGEQTEVALRAAADAFEIDVMDRGSGVAPAERERVFEPFYRATGSSEASGGVGLGLALVRQIARQHGGSASCLPRPGGGSIFRVSLPRA
jgi:signal transduction histidine kinase